MLTSKCFQFAITFLLALTFLISVVQCKKEEQELKNEIAQKNSPRIKSHRKVLTKNQLLHSVSSNQTDFLLDLKNDLNNSTSSTPTGKSTVRASRRWCRKKFMGSKRRQCIRRVLRQKRKHRHRHHHSLKCSRCSPGSFMESRCTREKDTVCTSCPQGSYTSHYSHRHQCLRCSQCGETLYILHPCSLVADAVCDSCQSATKRGPPFAEDYYLKCSFNATVTE